MEQLEAYYEPLWAKNVLVDFAHPEDDLSTCRLVLVPNLYLVADAAAANLEHFVDSGGTLAMSFFSGIVDPSEHIRLGGFSQPVRQMLGGGAGEFPPFAVGGGVRLRVWGGAQGGGRG